MTVHQQEIIVETRARSFTMIGEQVGSVVRKSGISLGLCTVFVQHTSASLLIQENADPAVRRDLERWLSSLAPESASWEHSDEGPDDMPAHAKSSLTSTSESIPVRAGRLMLGTWQGLYLWEHRSSSYQRRIIVHVAGE